MKIKKITIAHETPEKLYNLFAQYSQIYRSNSDNSLYFTFKGNSKTLLLNRKNVGDELSKVCATKFCKTLKLSELKSAYNSIQAVAKDCKDYKNIARLLYRCDDTIYYDYNHPKKVLSISSRGISIVDKNETDVLFIKDDINKDVEENIELNTMPEDLIAMLSNFFNVPNDQLILFIVYIISLFVPNINHPLLIVEGEYGAGKSVALKIISKIINGNTTLQMLPNKPDDIATILNANYFTAFDNVGYISQAISDLLCVSVTDGKYSKRKLYENTDVISLDIHKPVAVNGLGLNLTQNDLLDRVIMIDLNRIDENKRVTETELFGKLNQKLPKIKGGIFIVLRKALLKLQTVSLKNLPRLADFAQLGYCIAETLNEGYGEIFLKQYRDNIRIARHTAVENNPLLDTVIKFMENRDSWTGSMTELLQALKELYLKDSVSKNLPYTFPAAANTLSSKLKICQNDLKEFNIQLEFFRKTTRGITITKN